MRTQCGHSARDEFQEAERKDDKTLSVPATGNTITYSQVRLSKARNPARLRGPPSGLLALGLSSSTTACGGVSIASPLVLGRIGLHSRPLEKPAVCGSASTAVTTR